MAARLFAPGDGTLATEPFESTFDEEFTDSVTVGVLPGAEACDAQAITATLAPLKIRALLGVGACVGFLLGAASIHRGWFGGDPSSPPVVVHQVSGSKSRSLSLEAAASSPCRIKPSWAPWASVYDCSNVVVPCSRVGADCTISKCCADAGKQCYSKTDGWALCKDDCTSGVHAGDPDSVPWSCKPLGPRNARVGRVAKNTTCAVTGANCLSSRCCADPSRQCYRKDEYFAQCKTWCSVVEGRSCELLTPVKEVERRPDLGHARESAVSCSGANHDCRATSCCEDASMTCFEKDSFYAQCQKSCANTTSWNAGWSCKPLLPPSDSEYYRCAGAGHDCTRLRCCRDASLRCYTKDRYYAGCKASCVPGSTDPHDKDGKPWECRLLETL